MTLGPSETAQAAGARVQRAVVAKVCRRLLPLLFLACVFAQLDRANISMAALTMPADINLPPATFGFGVGAFLVIYAICEIPSNIGLVRFGARRWIARIMLTWGVVSAATSLVSGPTSFLINRALLAASEAGFLRGFLPICRSGCRRATGLGLFPCFSSAFRLPMSSAARSLPASCGSMGWVGCGAGNGCFCSRVSPRSCCRSSSGGRCAIPPGTRHGSPRPRSPRWAADRPRAGLGCGSI